MTLPNFLIIGSAKSGTTSLADYISQHPEVFMSSIKEPHYFTFSDEDVKFNGPGDHIVHRSIVTDLNIYTQLFKGVTDEIAIGEASTTYLSIPKAAYKIKAVVPNAQLIAILRNPVDKAYSSYLHLRRDGRESIKNFESALQEEEKRIEQNWGYLWRYKTMGFYYDHLRRYFDLFHKEQIKIYLYEDFCNDPQTVIADIFSHIGVNPEFKPCMQIHSNVSGIPQNRMLHQFLHTKNPIRSIFGQIVPDKIRKKIRKYNMKKPKLSPNIQAILKDEYRSDILKVQDLINQDLSSWI